MKRVILLSLLPFWVAADTVNLNVTGNITASPCVFNDGNSRVDVNLGDIQASNMMTAGSSAVPVAFNLRFSCCPAGTTSVSIILTGNEDPVSGSPWFKNNGTASNVAIGLRDVTSGLLKGNGSGLTQPVLSDRTATFPLEAFVYSGPGHAMPGTLSSVVIVTMQYN
ncbi:fimbrial protein [Lelliottia sp. WAP21]|uniref:fimbrial protein n=1 Tax=Lelliottia sp. WAP21 TaxID=2877426 RepID=UPI001E555F05|nr:fimbrial protein [Lelliottia sp. WAP21]